MIYNITINEDKTVEIDKEIVVNQYENEIDELVFKLPFLDFGYVGVFKSPLNTKLELPIVDNKITIGSEITSYPGTWSLIIVGKKDETIFISNFIELKSCRNHLSLKNTQEIDKNIELLYLELQETLNKLENVDLDDVSNLGDSLEEIKELIKSECHDLQQFVGGCFGNLNTHLTHNTTICTRIDGNVEDIKESINNLSTGGGETDLTEVNTKLDDIDKDIADLDADLVKHTTQLGNNTSTIMNSLNSFNNLIFGLQTPIYTLQNWIGNSSNKPDNTISNWSYWGLVRAEEAKAFAQNTETNTIQILDKLSEILELLKEN
jgi:hypothetical protein